jgi:hypothetical protein
MSPLRERMIEDMILAGLALGTRQAYTQAVRRLAAHYRRSPDQLSEEEVRSYLLELRQQGVARGTFKIGLYGLRFLYQHTLHRDWDLFREKGSSWTGSGCRMRCPEGRSVNCSATSAAVPGRASPRYACGLRISEAPGWSRIHRPRQPGARIIKGKEPAGAAPSLLDEFPVVADVAARWLF